MRNRSVSSANHKVTTNNLRRMFETAIDDCPQKLGLEKKVTKSTAVDRNIATLLCLGSGTGTGGGFIRLLLRLILVIVQKFLLSISHGLVRLSWLGSEKGYCQKRG